MHEVDSLTHHGITERTRTVSEIQHMSSSRLLDAVLHAAADVRLGAVENHGIHIAREHHLIAHYLNDSAE
jgi:hypothetical protein